MLPKLRIGSAFAAAFMIGGVAWAAPASAASVPSSYLQCPSGQSARPYTPGNQSAPGGTFTFLLCSKSGHNYAIVRAIYNRFRSSGSVTWEQSPRTC
jgi:hypothetical protein